MSKEKLLTIGYSTLAERISNIVPPIIDFPHEILVSIQNPKSVNIKLPTAFPFRQFVSNEKGVAKSRNVVLHHAEGKYLLFADDEITFNSEAISQVINYLETHPECDLVLTQTMDANGDLRKNYPTSETVLSRFNSAKAATYEMIVRTERIQQLAIAFDENFGAGVEQYLGDEYIFITDLIKKGGKAVFLPITLAIHPVESSGSGWGTTKDLKARSAIFTRVFGIWAPFVRLAFYIKNFQKTPGLKSLFLFTFNR